MDIVDFFELSTGKWFSHRTSHHLGSLQQDGAKTTLFVELLAKTDPAVIQLCLQQEIDPALALCSSRIAWETTLDRETRKRVGSRVVIAVADSDQSNKGYFLRTLAPTETLQISKSRFSLGEDDRLVVITEDTTLYSEECLWFESPNFRLRHSILRQANGFSTTAFCTEIRLGAASGAVEQTAQNSTTSD
jgi:hypothetical protein